MVQNTRRFAGMIAIVGMALTAPLAGASAATASTLPASSEQSSPVGIIAGNDAPETAWMVQIDLLHDGTWSRGCSGEQINENWVLTAGHCITSKPDAVGIYHSNSVVDRGERITATEYEHAPHGDIALIKLPESHPITSYPILNFAYTAKNSGTGTYYGFGLNENDKIPDNLREAQVSLDGIVDYPFAGWSCQQTRGLTGAANDGDSGGPLLVDGKVVAIVANGGYDGSDDSSADIADPTNYWSYAALLTDATAWIYNHR